VPYVLVLYTLALLFSLPLPAESRIAAVVWGVLAYWDNHFYSC
jgi:hypothetical protein